MFSRDQIKGVLYGCAYGDALAAPVEFLNEAQIRAKYPQGQVTTSGNPIRVTDDTQMMLYLGEAMVACGLDRLGPETLEKPLRHAFVQWLRDPENTRAPGMTCIKACRYLEKGKPWTKASRTGSKGCGANMRLAPVALLSVNDLAWPGTAALSQYQAGFTHGHPTGLVASELTVFTLRYLLEQRSAEGLLEAIDTYIQVNRNHYHGEWLADLWREAGSRSPSAFIELGWDECEKAFQRLKVALAGGRGDLDPCSLTGDGWIAEEAWATSLLSFLFYENEPDKALQRAAFTRGDSDSIACLTGGYIGAVHGIKAFPTAEIQKIEYRNRLEHLVEAFSARL